MGSIQLIGQVVVYLQDLDFLSTAARSLRRILCGEARSVETIPWY